MKQFALISRALIIASLTSLAACAGDEDLDPIGAEETLEPGETLLDKDCDPLVPTQCGFPFPSNAWLVDDSTTVTKKRVAFGAETLPKSKSSIMPDPSLWGDSDGFSTGQAPMTHMPGATVAGLPTQDTIDLSLTDASPTVLIEAETGDWVPHFAELDMSSDADEDRALMIRPVIRLKDATRYIVAVRRIVDAEGRPLKPTPVFKALRDGERLDSEPSVGRRRALYADIFEKLDRAGVSKSDLQIAWDYTTASRENNTRWLVHMRDDALKKVGEEGPTYTITSIEMDPNEHIWKRIHANFRVPLYLDRAEPGGRLVFDVDGLPMQTGWTEFPIVIHIPNSVKKGEPAALLQNGHGLLGSKFEGQNGYLAELSDKKNYVSFSVDLVGFAGDDQELVLDAVGGGDIGKFRAVVDRQHQGIVNSLLAMRMMKGRFWKDAEAQYNGHSVIDPAQSYYRGDSQGGIFGTTYMALTTEVPRGLLGEPGLPYNLLLNRSTDFGPFFAIMKIIFRSGRDIQLILGLTQMHWDRTEPNGYVPYIVEDTLPNTPPHEVLLHVAIGDYQVTPLGAHIIARSTKAKNVAPVNRSIWGIEEATAPFSGSGIVEFAFQLPEAPKTNTPPAGPSDDDPHDKVRVLGVAHKQTDTFLRTGVIENPCVGPCDPQ
ncbi:MAG: hypothetical protein HUU21_13000 [Polyangiaceae bacterium]|nr:hypothetical protein [Polyangiaceae bacterium]